VIEAFLDLLHEGQELPTSQQVAERSGVSPSTIFRLFEDLEGMYTEAHAILAARVAELIVPIPPEGTVAERAARQVRARARLYERIAPVQRFQRRVFSTSHAVRSNRAATNAYFRAQLDTLFADELRHAPAGALDAVDALTSWEMWDRLRTTQGLSVARAEEIVIVLAVSALAPAE
jgi:AcrR family transcriptional regulator